MRRVSGFGLTFVPGVRPQIQRHAETFVVDTTQDFFAAFRSDCADYDGRQHHAAVVGACLRLRDDQELIGSHMADRKDGLMRLMKNSRCMVASWRPTQSSINVIVTMLWPEVLRIELEQHDVAVLDDIFFAFVARLAGFLGGNFAAERHEVVIGDRLCADEAALEVGVDDARRLRRLGAASGPSRRAFPSARR